MGKIEQQKQTLLMLGRDCDWDWDSVLDRNVQINRKTFAKYR